MKGKLRSYIGIDNGVTGSMALISPDRIEFRPIPVKKELNYTKKKATITRLDWEALEEILGDWVLLGSDHFRVFIERPFTGKGFRTVASAMRCLESMLICVERLGVSYSYVSSGDWQKALLPKGCKGPELKSASRVVGIRLFPHLKGSIEKQKDADGLLIAEWARRENL